VRPPNGVLPAGYEIRYEKVQDLQALQTEVAAPWPRQTTALLLGRLQATRLPEAMRQQDRSRDAGGAGHAAAH
jgi:hypothetical protein